MCSTLRRYEEGFVSFLVLLILPARRISEALQNMSYLTAGLLEVCEYVILNCTKCGLNCICELQRPLLRCDTLYQLEVPFTSCDRIS